MARAFDEALGHFLTANATSSQAVGRQTGTIAFWVRPAATANIYNLLYHFLDANNYIDLIEGNGIFGIPLRVEYKAGGTSKTVSLTSLSVNTWAHLCITYSLGADQLKFYKNAVAGTTATALGTFSTSGTASLTIADGPETPFNGQIAELACWSAALTQGEVTALAKGAAPSLVRPSALEVYYPLIGRNSPETDIVSGGTATSVNFPTAAEHPPVYAPRGRRSALSFGAAGGGSTTTTLVLTRGATTVPRLGQTTITVTGDGGAVVPGVTLSANGGTFSGLTDSSGVATYTAPNINGTFTITPYFDNGTEVLTTPTTTITVLSTATITGGGNLPA